MFYHIHIMKNNKQEVEINPEEFMKLIIKNISSILYEISAENKESSKIDLIENQCINLNINYVFFFPQKF